jgi:hypothetical protein
MAPVTAVPVVPPVIIMSAVAIAKAEPERRGYIDRGPINRRTIDRWRAVVIAIVGVVIWITAVIGRPWIVVAPCRISRRVITITITAYGDSD